MSLLCFVISCSHSVDSVQSPSCGISLNSIIAYKNHAFQTQNSLAAADMNGRLLQCTYSSVARMFAHITCARSITLNLRHETSDNVSLAVT